VDLKKIEKLKPVLKAMLRNSSSIKPADLQAIALQVGRKRVKRGTEPNYEKRDPPPLVPLSIPNHKPTLRQGTARSVINTLINDVDVWELYLNEQVD
jgi:hypothetical protein